MEKTCDRCANSEKFERKLPHDKSDWGCRADGWEGYVNPDHPACGGIHFWERK